MRVHKGVSSLPVFSSTVLTIGSFDGVHRGHHEVISRCVEEAKSRGAESILVSFNPHPREFFASQNASDRIKMLSTDAEKEDILRTTGLDHLVIVRFDEAFAQQSPISYLENFIYRHFSPQLIVIGFDHRFGQGRSGNITLMQSWATQKNIEVSVIPKSVLDDHKTSSTRIRKLLSLGKVRDAGRLLGRAYSARGIVLKGDQIGRKIGYPTANVSVAAQNKLLPPPGIYVARCRVSNTWQRAMAYIGQRPAISDSDERRFEVHLLDYNGDLYDSVVEVEFLRHIRNDSDFESLEALGQTLSLDERSTRAYFESKVAVVILNYNGLDHLKEYLRSIAASLRVDDELIVIDNASQDDSVSWIQKHYPELRVIQHEENYGFAGGYSRGLEQIEADYFVLINSDLSFERDWYVDIILQMAREDSIAAAQPKILSLREPTRFEYAGAAGGLLDKWYYPFCHGRVFNQLEEDHGQYDVSQEIFWASGAAMVIKADLFLDFGGFDERFFAHQEEIDLCWRLKRAGYKIMTYPEQRIYHLGGGTLAYGSPFKTYLNFRNSLYMIFNNAPGPVLPKLIWRGILDGVAFFKFMLEGHFRDALSVLKAHGSIWGSLRTSVQKRKAYRNRIEELKIGPNNKKGMSKKSIIIQHFLFGKKKTNELL